jgi:hypothetical protein
MIHLLLLLSVFRLMISICIQVNLSSANNIGNSTMIHLGFKLRVDVISLVSLYFSYDEPFVKTFLPLSCRVSAIA